MIGTITKYDGDLILSYDIDSEKAEKIIDRLLKYYKERCHTGEGIYQNDEAQIEAIEVMSELCDDIIKFEENWKD